MSSASFYLKVATFRLLCSAIGRHKKSDLCDLSRATWHCPPRSRLVLEPKRAESATFSAGALSISPSCSQLLFPHFSRECGRSEGCVYARPAHTSTEQPTPSATATMKITSGLQTEFPQAPAMPLFHPVNCTSPFASLCSLLTFNFTLLPARLEKSARTRPRWTNLRYWSLFFFPLCPFLKCLTTTKPQFLLSPPHCTRQFQIFPFFVSNWIFSCEFVFFFYSHISILIALGCILLFVLTFLSFPFMLRLKFRACGLSVQYFTGTKRIAKRDPAFFVFCRRNKVVIEWGCGASLPVSNEMENWTLTKNLLSFCFYLCPGWRTEALSSHLRFCFIGCCSPCSGRPLTTSTFLHSALLSVLRPPSTQWKEGSFCRYALVTEACGIKTMLRVAPLASLRNWRDHCQFVEQWLFMDTHTATSQWPQPSQVALLVTMFKSQPGV